MNEAGVVGNGESLSYFAGGADRLGNRQRGLTLEECVERFPFQEWHGNEWDAFFLADVVDRADVIVFDLGRRLSFSDKSRTVVFVGGDLGPHHLEGDPAL